jgi:hypothetical protein
MDLDFPKAIAHPIAAGLMGAIVGLRFAPGGAWWERASNVAAGALCAGYVSPAAAEVLGLGSSATQSALAFLLGMFGMSLAAAVLTAVQTVKWADIVTRKLGGKGGGDA